MKSSSGASRLSFLVGAAMAGTAIAAALLIQDVRHGWPFTRHHEQSASADAAGHTDASEYTQTSSSRGPVTIDSVQFERLGVQLEPARLERIVSSARYAAIVTPDESRISHIHTRVSGWVEQLHVNTTGERVRAGQALAAVFSQDLFASQTEYVSALKRSASTPDSAVLDAARTRLRVLGMSDQEIARLERTGSAKRLVTITAPRSGIVLRRAVTVGTAVDPSTELMTIADLSRVWVLAEVPEREGARLEVGTEATLAFPGAGRASFAAPVEFVYPTLTERTRTVRVRFAVSNPDAVLRPGLYGTATFDTKVHQSVTVARDAVVDTGESQHVFVRAPGGMLEPRDVLLGARLADRVEVLSGIEPGEEVVTSGVFLIDSESRLRATGAGTGHSGHGQASSIEPTSVPESGADAGHSGHDG